MLGIYSKSHDALIIFISVFNQSEGEFKKENISTSYFLACVFLQIEFQVGIKQSSQQSSIINRCG